MSVQIRVEIPLHLARLAGTDRHEVTVEVTGSPTIAATIDAIEKQYPMLEGTIRDHGATERRPWLRFFVCEEDWSHRGLGAVLPEEVTSGKEPIIVLGAIAGG